MPREEQLPPSKDGRLADEITSETILFSEYSEAVLYSTRNTSDKLDLIITFFNKSNAINKLLIEDLTDRIKLLETS